MDDWSVAFWCGKKGGQRKGVFAEEGNLGHAGPAKGHLMDDTYVYIVHTGINVWRMRT